MSTPGHRSTPASRGAHAGIGGDINQTATELSASHRAEAKPAKSSRGRLPKFTREQVFQVALEIIDEHGREALTMRNLADAMQTGTTTLYYHVKSKEEVLEGVEALLVGPLAADLDPDLPWDQQLMQALRRLRAVQRAHPGFVEVFITQAVPGPALDAVRNGLMGILRTAGFSRHDAAYILAALNAFALGFAITDRARASVQQPQEIRRMRDLPAQEYPHLADMAVEWAEHDPERAFELGMRTLIASFKIALGSGPIHIPYPPE